MTKSCPYCKRKVKGHPNKKFCGQKCKDNYHNMTNPRGYGLKSWRDTYADEIHPFDLEESMIG